MYATAIIGTILLGWGLFGLFDDDDDSSEETSQDDFDNIQKGGPDSDTMTGTDAPTC